MGNLISFKLSSKKNSALHTSSLLKQQKFRLSESLKDSHNFTMRYTISCLIISILVLIFALSSEYSTLLIILAYVLFSYALHFILSLYFRLIQYRLNRNISRLKLQVEKQLEDYKNRTEFEKMKSLIEEDEYSKLEEEETIYKRNYKSQNSLIDGVFDVFIGEDPTKKYALICKGCKRNNGLCLPDEIEKVKFICYFCKRYNDNEQNKNTNTNKISK